MTGSYFRGDAEAVLSPGDEAKFDSVTYTYYEQLNGYEWLKRLDIGYFFYSGAYADDILAVLDRSEEHTSELQSLMRISYAVFCLKKKSMTNTPLLNERTHTLQHELHTLNT